MPQLAAHIDVSPADLAELLAAGDGLEVSPVATDGDSCWVCDPPEAAMWSVYIHRDGQGVQCIADYHVDQFGREDAERHAYALASWLLARNPQLGKHGINCSAHG